MFVATFGCSARDSFCTSSRRSTSPIQHRRRWSPPQVTDSKAAGLSTTTTTRGQTLRMKRKLVSVAELILSCDLTVGRAFRMTSGTFTTDESSSLTPLYGLHIGGTNTTSLPPSQPQAKSAEESLSGRLFAGTSGTMMTHSMGSIEGWGKEESPSALSPFIFLRLREPLTRFLRSLENEADMVASWSVYDRGIRSSVRLTAFVPSDSTKSALQ